MIQSDILNLREFCKALGEEIPQLCWHVRGTVAYGRFAGKNLRIVVGQRGGNFTGVICRGFVKRGPSATLDLTSVMFGPARMTRTVRGTNQLESSWPMILSPPEHRQSYLPPTLPRF